jgi:hypothetical protein
MNLLPDTEREDVKKGLKIRSMVVFSFMLAASFLVGFVLLLPSYFLAWGNFAKTGKESNSLNLKNSDSAGSLLDLPAEVDSKLKVFQSSLASASAYDSLSKVLGFLPQEIVLDSVSFAQDKVYNEKNGSLISISGTAGRRDSLISFANLLKRSGLFSAVDMPVSNLAKDRNLPFSINVFIEN